MTNKLYLRGPWPHKNEKVIIGIGKEIIAFGRTIKGVPSGEEFIHFKKEDWKKIREFIDEATK